MLEKRITKKRPKKTSKAQIKFNCSSLSSSLYLSYQKQKKKVFISRSYLLSLHLVFNQHLFDIFCCQNNCDNSCISCQIAFTLVGRRDREREEKQCMKLQGIYRFQTNTQIFCNNGSEKQINTYVHTNNI